MISLTSSSAQPIEFAYLVPIDQRAVIEITGVALHALPSSIDDVDVCRRGGGVDIMVGLGLGATMDVLFEQSGHHGDCLAERMIHIAWIGFRLSWRETLFAGSLICEL